MFHFPYGGGGADGDPNLNLLSAVCGSAAPPLDHPSFFDAEGAFPASSSLPSPNDCFMHRSSSTRSLVPHRPHIPNPASSSARDYLDFHQPEPVRRVYSTGDLQGMVNTQEGAAGALAGRVGRYSAEERKERIERYRNKRNQRNFHKKITYACRKTLADSRPRVRGRFARNGEMEAELEVESSETILECYSHNTCDDSGGGRCNNLESSGDWLKQMQAALATTQEECCYDEDIWATLDSTFSVNLLF